MDSLHVLILVFIPTIILFGELLSSFSYYQKCEIISKLTIHEIAIRGGYSGSYITHFCVDYLLIDFYIN